MPLKPYYQLRLRESYAHVAASERWPRSQRAIRLPSSLDIRATPGGSGVTLTLGTGAVLANMQTDAAAFEGWALALRLWCQEPAVTLDWAVPAVESGHYQRFLYRVARFQSLFSGWVRVADEAKLVASRVLNPRANLVLNTASKSRAVGAERLAALLPETKLEVELVADPAFAARYGLDRVDRQFPVGLFEGAVSARSAVFTGGKSAIDIVGVGADGFWLFELKAGRNAPIGGLTELLFYTSLIRDAAGPAARFQFGSSPAGAVIGPADVLEARAINAVLLIEASHPLLDHPELVEQLNLAAAASWNREPGAVPVTFQMARLA